MASQWILSNSKSLQVSRTRLSILNNIIVWTVSTRSLICIFSIALTKTLRIVLRAPITFGIPIIFMFHRFFLVFWQGLSTCLFVLFDFHSFIHRGRQVHNLASSRFFLIITRPGLLAGIRLSIVSKKSVVFHSFLVFRNSFNWFSFTDG